MGEVVKQLNFSPVANSPAFSDHFATNSSSFPVTRLDGSLASTWGATQQQQQAGLFGHKRSAASFRAPIDDDDEDDDDEDFQDYSAAAAAGAHTTAAYSNMQFSQQQQSASAFSSSRGNAGPAASGMHPVQAVLRARTKQLQAESLLLAGQQQQRLHQQMQAVEQQLAAQLAEVQQQLQHKRARAAAADEESRVRRSAERSRVMQEVARQQAALEQAQASALQEAQKRAAAEEAARRAAAEAEAARQRQLQEAERKKKEAEAAAAAAKAAEEVKAREAAAKAAAQQQQQQQQTAVAAGSAAAAVASKPRPPVSAADPHLKATAAALEYEQLLAQKLADAEAAASELMNRPELKQQRRALEKQITMAVSQISGTQQQVQAKSKQLVEVLTSCSTPQQQALAYLTLASRVVSQCEGQVQKIGSFAFPLAYVCVAVGAAVPSFMELLLAKLQKACPLLVPKYTMYSSNTSKDAWFSALGYKEIEDPKTGVQRRENSDEFVSRMSSMVLLYGAIVQTDAAGNPAGLAHGWAWLARCLNSLPPTRPSATALMSFLAHAGYRMAAVYGRQFIKLMSHVTQHYLPALEAKASKDADLRAVGTRLQTYVQTQQYCKEPEGRTLKKVDESSYTRA